MNARTNILILGTADWDQPIATNQHYMTREFIRDKDLSVTFVESLGLRAPSLSKRDLSRIVSRLRSAAGQRGHGSSGDCRQRPGGLTVSSPIVLPWHRGIAALVNRPLLEKAVLGWINSDGPKVLWTYTPVTYGLEAYADKVYYHCVDLLAEFEGIDRRVIENGETHLSRLGVEAIASSEVVKTHLEKVGFRSVLLWENVADTSKIFEAGPEGSVRTPGRVLFAGNLSPKKIDYGLLEGLARAGLTVVLAGPRAEGGGSDEREFQSLLSAGVEYVGMLDMKGLAEEMVRSCIGVIPYRINAYTRGVSPLKTFEYLAAGLAVVSTALPGVKECPGHVWVEDERSFGVRVAELSGTAPSSVEIRDRMNTACLHSWSRRGEEARTLVQGGVEE